MSRLLLSPLCPAWMIVLWTVVCLGLLLWEAFRMRTTLRGVKAILQAGLSCLTVLFAAVLLLQPSLVREAPQAQASRLIVLQDASRSMETRDLPGQKPRRDLATQILKSDALERLGEEYRLERWLFARQLSGWTSESGSLTGGTALGDVLRQAASEIPGMLPAGAILVVSDGRNNLGEAPLSVAKWLKERQIPVSCLQVGSHLPLPDAGVRFTSGKLETVKRDELTIPLEVKSTFDREEEITVVLKEGGEVLETRKVLIPARGSVVVTFAVRPQLAGLRTYAVAITPPNGDCRLDDDADFLSVQVTEPEQFRLLYLAAHLGGDWRFLRRFVEDSEQFDCAAVIRLAQDKFFSCGWHDGERPKDAQGFPQSTAEYADFDAVILDTRAAAELSQVAQDALLAFCARKGGGVLLCGPPDLVPVTLRPLLTLEEAAAEDWRSSRNLLPDKELVFDSPSSRLRDLRDLSLPAPGLSWPVQKLKPGARGVLADYVQGSQVLSVQNYGAGRSAYLAVEGLWRWLFDERTGSAVYGDFWSALVLWLSANPQPSLQVMSPGQKVTLEDSAVLAVQVLDEDFLPAAQAQVKVAISSPQGDTSLLTLEPSWEEPGLYAASFSPADFGEYRLHFQAQVEDRLLQADDLLLAVSGGAELEIPEADGETLADLARLTGGRFALAQDWLEHPWTPPASPTVPTSRQVLPLVNAWWFLLLFAVALGAAIWYRRRLGLK